MPRGTAITPETRDAYFALRKAGYQRTPAAKKIGIAYNTAVSLDKKFGTPKLSGPEIHERNRLAEAGEPTPYELLSERAKRGWNDFAFFQRTYLGRIPIPWQVEAAERIVAMVDSDEEEWAVVSAPPGSGKSTNFAHDLPAWLTVRNRAITGLLGSAVQNTAEAYIRRLMDTFERSMPLKADSRLIRLGLAVDAEATLAEDYGRFRPEKGIWSAAQFVVAQLEGQLVAEKEPTWSAFGREGGVLGMRYQFVIWDDLVSDKRLNSQEMIDADREWYSDIAESRLEPGGTFILQGQRLGPSDLYGYALKMRRLPDEIDEEAEYDDEMGTVPKYHHIKFKAHYEELCENNHKLTAPAYGEPGGCLLFPRRLSWRRLSPIMIERNSRFRVVYQQEEVDPETVLVQKAWVNGSDGHVGCWDKERDRLQTPEGIDLSRCISVVAVDPSPSNYWAIGWWLIDPAPESGPRRYLIDLERRGMGANKFLDYNIAKQEYSGVAETMQQTSYQLGIPITHWIIETNAAQKFMTQYDAVQNWQKLHGIRIIPQDTYRNKSDASYGVQTIGGIWERGQVRLPGKNGSHGRIAAMKLVDEVTQYPHSRTDDCVMQQWFVEWHMAELIKYQKRHDNDAPPAARPSWYNKEMGDLASIAGTHTLHPHGETAAQKMMALMSERAAS